MLKPARTKKFLETITGQHFIYRYLFGTNVLFFLLSFMLFLVYLIFFLCFVLAKFYFCNFGLLLPLSYCFSPRCPSFIFHPLFKKKKKEEFLMKRQTLKFMFFVIFFFSRGGRKEGRGKKSIRKTSQQQQNKRQIFLIEFIPSIID